MSRIGYVNHKGGTGDVSINQEPDICPVCNYHGKQQKLYSASIEPNLLHIHYRCPSFKCQATFIAIYKYCNPGNGKGIYYELNDFAPKTLVTRDFSEDIINISSQFVEIYNQAQKAECIGLTDICGVGYRKAMEFLIKDYLIERNSEDADIIKKQFLGQCIDQRVDNSNIKICAERAIWIGNDETHYVRRHNTKDVQDMKTLIDLTIHWIESEIRTKRYLEGMQSQK